MIVFKDDLEFADAVMNVLKERLALTVEVELVSDRDYYNPGKVPKVEVDLNDKDEDGVGLIARGSGKAD